MTSVGQNGAADGFASGTIAPRDPAEMRLDQATEGELYAHYRQYFQAAEEQRRWNVWQDVPWDSVGTSPSDPLVEAVLAAYREELFLPDYVTELLRTERASRGRTWWLTRWSYEEGKHVMALHEWLTRSGAYTDDEMRDWTEAQLAANRWAPPHTDGIGALVEMLLWEGREIERYRALRHHAADEADTAMTALLDRVLDDEEHHRSFLAEALGIIGRRHGAAVQEAVTRVAADHGEDAPKVEAALRAEIGELAV
jgi:acyl-[acyl-carrier-protein] desaturase